MTVLELQFGHGGIGRPNEAMRSLVILADNVCIGGHPAKPKMIRGLAQLRSARSTLLGLPDERPSLRLCRMECLLKDKEGNRFDRGRALPLPRKQKATRRQ